MNAYIALLIKYLPEMVQAGGFIMEYAKKVRENAMAKDEWPDEAERIFTESLAAREGPGKPRAYKTDEEIAAEGK